jgi:uncharacterized protein (DUF1810 family)
VDDLALGRLWHARTIIAFEQNGNTIGAVSIAALARCWPMADPFDLDRFVHAQRETYGRALAELRDGAKRSHWMWYVFPQIAGLGHSPMAQRFAISGLAEARAYLAHPILGVRLREATSALGHLAELDARGVFGEIDAVKLRSCLTLFAYADALENSLFRATLDRWFDGIEDAATVERL